MDNDPLLPRCLELLFQPINKSLRTILMIRSPCVNHNCCKVLTSISHLNCRAEENILTISLSCSLLHYICIIKPSNNSIDSKLFSEDRSTVVPTY